MPIDKYGVIGFMLSIGFVIFISSVLMQNIQHLPDDLTTTETLLVIITLFVATMFTFYLFKFFTYDLWKIFYMWGNKIYEPKKRRRK